MTEPILSQELKVLLDYIKNQLISEFPINTITLNYLVLGILDNQNCDGYAVISKLMMRATIDEFKGFITNLILADCQRDIKTGSESKFSNEFDIIASEIANEGRIVSSALLLKFIVNKNHEISNQLNLLGVSNGQLSDVVLAYTSANDNKDDIKPNRKPKKKIIRSKTEDVSVDNIGMRVIPEESNSVEASCENLVRKASTGAYDNIIGLDDIVDSIFDVLGKYDRNTVAVIGPSGVGKTSVIERLAKRIYDQKCPIPFRDKYVMKFNDQINSMIINDMNRIGKYIAFIDDIEKLFINKETEMNNMFVLSELFKCPNISTIFCMNDAQYTKIIESKPDFARKIYKLKIDEPTSDDLTDIVRKNCEVLGSYNNVRFSDECSNTAINLAKRFITNEKLPKSAIDILDLAGSYARMRHVESDELLSLRNRLNEIVKEKCNILNSGSSDDFDRKDLLIREEIDVSKMISNLEEIELNRIIEVSVDNIKTTVSKMTGIPLNEMDDDEKGKLRNLFNNITEHVIGQDDAVMEICKAVKRQRVGLSNPNKPCVLMFVGTTGTGKSFLAKRLAHEMFGDEKNMVRLDMSEYSDKTSATRLYGASAGYIGYEDGGILTEAIKKKNRCVLLLDEIEKASEEVFNVFLQVFDEGRLTDSKGTTVDFKNVIIIMTSNVGAKNVTEKVAKIGFSKVNENEEDKDIILKSIKKAFKPEFINRIDNICYFNKLTDDNLIQIIKNEVKKVQKKVIELGYDLDNEILDGKLIDSIFNNVKEEAEYGARPILREIQKQLEDKLTDYIIDNNVPDGYIFHYNDIY